MVGRINRVAVLAVVGMAAMMARGEAPYQFRERLNCVHRVDRRDCSLKAAANEFEFANGTRIVIADDAPALLRRAAADFADYLLVSMGVNASVVTAAVAASRDRLGTTGTVTVALAPAASDQGYSTSVTAAGVAITASDDRLAAQAFYHLEDLMNLRRGPFLALGEEKRSPRFKLRMTFPGYGNCIAPDAHLMQLAHYGFTAIEIWLDDYDVISQGVRQDVNDLIDRAARCGLGVSIQPRNRCYIHPDDPRSDAGYDAAYGALAKYYPKALGAKYSGEVCEFPSKDPRANGGDHLHRKPEDKAKGLPYPGWFPCYDWAPWAAKVSAIIRRYNPGFKFVMSTYNWGFQDEQARAELVAALPKDTVLIPVFEMFEKHVKRNGLVSPVADYSLAFPGPGKYFRTEAAQAKSAGLELWSNCNSAGLTWDHGNIPYEPSPWQWKKKWDALSKAHDDYGLSGLRESHEYGWYPSFIAELEKEFFTDGGMDFETHLRKIAARDFGEANVEKALEAWRLFSQASDDFVPTDDNQYGPCRIGAAYPYNFGGKPLQEGWAAPKDFPLDPGMKFDICWFDYDKPMGGLGTAALALDESLEEKEIELFRSIVDNYRRGTELFRSMQPPTPSALQPFNLSTLQPFNSLTHAIALGEFLWHGSQTALNVKLGRRAFRRGDMDEVRRIAKEEYENAKAALPAVDADSRLGFLVSSGYTGGRPQIEWKLRKMRELYGIER